MTSSLFATTVLASFFVVALPHILPCPAPRVAYADSSSSSSSDPSRNAAWEVVVITNPDGSTTTKRRRLRRPLPPRQSPEVRDGIAAFVGGGAETAGEGDASRDAGAHVDADVVGMGSASSRPRGGRECPVPKPGGIIGELMGFKRSSAGADADADAEGGGDPTTTTTTQATTTTTTTSGSTIRPRIMTQPRREEKGDEDDGGSGS